MHALDASLQSSVYALDDDGDGLSVAFATADVDDSVASQTQMQFSSNARSYTQEQFRMVAENMQDAGNILYLFG